MLTTPALFSACHDNGWRSVYLCLQFKKQDFYLTIEQGSTGNFHLKVKGADAAKVSAFFAAPAPSQVVKWKPLSYAWYRLWFVNSKKTDEINLRILVMTPLSIRFTSVPFSVNKLVQLGHAWQALAASPPDPT
ncbi:hypothetical protein [Pseudomonas costantinii]|uniref:Uncharacterized protein n=1 Tax=Pseudomonas costantinii TaxID=168469 RepID=A0A1S2UR40_9PSED|nr:hypothetical protein [Pseudomonas costantinii]OIN48356.1 hypothetical protein BFL40_24495 [Pseudomonas costantinii]SED52555.1 hypothetical protein SAMN04515675_1441 [Pseudomonas costantinii]